MEQQRIHAQTRGFRSDSHDRRGFTLVELILVLFIIAAVAGLVIPQLSMLGRSTDMATSAKTQADLANNIGAYFILQKRFPLGMDSLLVGDGSGVPSDVYLPVDDASGDQASGLPDSGPHLDRDLEMVDLADTSAGASIGFQELGSSGRTGFSRSFTRGGFEFVYDHDRGVLNSNDSAKFTAARTLDRNIGGAGCHVAKVRDDAALIDRLMPGGVVEPDTILVALGVGPNVDMRSKTLSNSPIYPGCDGSYYGRYVAIFKLYANGERPTLVAVVDSYGRDPDYTQQQFNESLPDDSRRG
ncbi:MAG: prepilin-type N-terminal cleavage/methylation domain-containing protein [Planctomycetota bacterium]